MSQVKIGVLRLSHLRSRVASPQSMSDANPYLDAEISLLLAPSANQRGLEHLVVDYQLTVVCLSTNLRLLMTMLILRAHTDKTPNLRRYAVGGLFTIRLCTHKTSKVRGR